MSNKTSDKNVANIEEDVKIVKEFIDYAQGVIDDMEYERPVDVTVYQKDLTSMQNILAEREQMLKERDVANDSVIAHKFAVMQQQINEKDKRIQELEEELAKYKDIDYMFKIDSNENRVDMKKIYFEWLEYKNKIQKLEEESEILEFQNKQVENYAEELKKYNKTVSDRMVEYKKNSIPKQVVIDKMEELNKEIKSCDEVEAIFKIKQQQVLQELLEGEKNEF